MRQPQAKCLGRSLAAEQLRAAPPWGWGWGAQGLPVSRPEAAGESREPSSQVLAWPAGLGAAWLGCHAHTAATPRGIWFSFQPHNLRMLQKALCIWWKGHLWFLTRPSTPLPAGYSLPKESCAGAGGQAPHRAGGQQGARCPGTPAAQIRRGVSKAHAAPGPLQLRSGVGGGVSKAHPAPGPLQLRSGGRSARCTLPRAPRSSDQAGGSARRTLPRPPAAQVRRGVSKVHAAPAPCSSDQAGGQQGARCPRRPAAHSIPVHCGPGAPPGSAPPRSRPAAPAAARSGST